MNISGRIFTVMSVLCVFCAVTSDAQLMPQDSWVFRCKWGTNGTANGQFGLYNGPRGVAVAQDGRVFVGDVDNYRIQVFEADGTFVRKWGSSGSTDGKFNSIMAVAVAPNGRVFVADSGNSRIQVFEADGTFVRKWGTNGTGNGQLKNPSGVAVAPDGRVVVADRGNNRIQVFEADGAFVRKWGSSGPLDGQFSNPWGVAVAPDGRVFIADTDNHRIQVFEADGTFVRKWGRSGSSGGPGGTFVTANAVAVAADGLVFVSDSGGGIPRIQVFEADGTFIRKWGSWGSLGGQFKAPWGMAVGSDGRLVVADPGNMRIQVFGKATYRLAYQSGNDVPTPLVTRCVQRLGMPYLDIDYVVRDSDSPILTVAVAAFQDGTNSLQSFVRASTFVDGTDNAVGTNITANVTNRLSWNVAGDWQADYVNLKVCVMAKDERGLLGIDFLNLPASGSDPALSISRFPISQADMLPLWFWLLARGDPAVRLENGRVLADVALAPGGANGPSGPHGLLATYYASKSLSDASFQVIDSEVDFTTTSGAWPYAPLTTTNFSVCWSGVVVPDYSETYTFYANAADGVRLWVNDVQLVNYWNDGSAERSGTIALQAGLPYALRMEYYQNTGTAVAQLKWSSLSQSKQIIPYRSLFTGSTGEGSAPLVYASQQTTSAAGRNYLFGEIGVREATASELNQARTRPSGVVNQFTPRITVGPEERPKKVNEYNFDTGDWGSNGWWVVKE
jgi:hypothetical protein